MTLYQIRAVGFFLATYESDLLYIENFRKFRKGRIPSTTFCQKGNHSFYSFLSEFKVTRNFKKSKCNKILLLTEKWLDKGKITEVDNFALHLRSLRLTHGKTMTSLSSKILFLNKPQKLFPFDNRVKKSVEQDSNLYSDYKLSITNFKRRHNSDIQKCLKKITPFAIRIEKNFEQLSNIEAIRKNRLIDKLLWTLNGYKE
jgi:hypothetical protein